MKSSNFAVVRTATAVTQIAVTNKTECLFQSTKLKATNVIHEVKLFLLLSLKEEHECTAVNIIT
jgi:hypothetical protein